MIIVWEVTSHCNLDCTFCYNHWKRREADRPADLDTGSMERVARRIADAFPVSVTLTGGEPLLRQDLEQLVHRLRELGIKVGVATNGLLLDEARARSLRRSGVSWFEVPLHGCRPGTVLELTGIDCFQRVKNAMLAVRSSGAELTASHIITSRNHAETGLVVRTAFALGARALALNRFVPCGAGEGRPDLLPSRKQLNQALESASEASSLCPGMKVYTAIPVEPCIHSHGRFPYLEFGGCVCGTRKWVVGPSAGLRVCEQSPDFLGNLITHSFREMISSDQAAAFRSSLAFPECDGCRSRDSCGGGCRFLHRYL